ncbi:hypothetical protein [Lysinibacillus cavernae]|nr:hypothetical protein [Lysinibacillus cavernae]
MDKQMSMFDLVERPMKKPTEDFNKTVDKKNVVTPRKIGYIVQR